MNDIQADADVKLIEDTSTKKVIILFTIQYLIGMAAKAYDISANYEMGLSWIGIILGWGSIFCGFTFKKRIKLNRSKIISNIYLAIGIILLFIGGLTGGWIIAIGHQLFGYYNSKGVKYLSIQFVIWIVLYIAFGILLGTILSILGINIYAQ